MKKKIVVLFLVGVMALSMAACGKSNNTTGNSAAAETSESSEASAPIEYTANSIKYDALKCVKLGEYEKMNVDVEGTFDVTDDDVQEYITQQVLNFPEYKDADKTTVEDGDVVNTDYVLTVDGKEYQAMQDVNFTIGSGTNIDGFEDGLVGATVGETVNMTLTFPEDYYETTLAGKEGVFDVTINKIQEEVPMTFENLNDDYVSNNFKESMGVETVDAYMDAIRANLESQNEYNKESAVQNAVISKLEEVCEVTIPQDYLDARIADYKAQYEQMVKSQYNMSMEDFVQSTMNQSMDQFNAGIADYIESQLNQELILEAIAKEQDLKLDQDKYNEFVKSYMTYYGYESEDSFYNQNGGKEFVEKRVLDNQTLQYVCDNAVVNYIEPTAADTTAEDSSATQEAQ